MVGDNGERDYNLIDISNFETPIQALRNPRFHTSYSHLYKSAIGTPSTNPSNHQKISERIKALEMERSGFSRQQQIKKQKSFKSLSRYMISWLNFLFSKPDYCGCYVSAFGDERKRGDIFGNGVDIYSQWRNPKLQRDFFLKSADDSEDLDFSNSCFSSLQSSLHNICSFDDLKSRMRRFLSLNSCRNIFRVMTQVTKNIDEGRLRMKKHCPIITDIGMKEKATRVLMCYNPFWLRIGLYVILGGDSLMADSRVSYDKEIAFLKIIIERQLYSHAGLAKIHSYSKLVDGAYKPEYFERLGDVLLKRFLLFVLILDEAKSQSSISINCGIDGVDGGSPLLFNPYSVVKSSHQMIHELLPVDVMHGEGNLISHLMTIGYTVSFIQHPITEFDFEILYLFEDLKDGVRLSRAINLLENDPSILSKLILPADTPKRNLTNCGIVLQHLKQAGVPCCDEDGTTIHSEDITSGDKELVLSLIWNMFTHLQLPLIINKKFIHEETTRILGKDKELKLPGLLTPTCSEMLFFWIQAICENYGVQLETFSSMVGGKALWCLLDCYSNKELDVSHEAMHNDLLLSQKLMKLLGGFSEIICVRDLDFKETCGGKTVVIILAFLSSALFFKTNKNSCNHNSFLKSTSASKNKNLSQEEKFVNHSQGDAVKLIQTHFRKWAAHREFGKMKEKVSMLQMIIKAWLIMKPKASFYIPRTEEIYDEMSRKFKPSWRYAMLMVDRHRFVRMRRSAVCIQHYVREWIKRKKNSEKALDFERLPSPMLATTGWQIHQSLTLGYEEVVTSFTEKISEDPALFISGNYSCKHDYAAAEIQRHYRGWILQKIYINKKHACFRIQNRFRCFIAQTYFEKLKFAAVEVQSHIRKSIAYRQVSNIFQKIVVIQKCYRGSLLRRDYCLKKKAAVIIQSIFRGSKCQKSFGIFRYLAIQIQCTVRGDITRRNLLGASHTGLEEDKNSFKSFETRLLISRVLKIQRWWKGLFPLVKLRIRSVIVLQSHFRVFIVKRKYTTLRHFVILIQSRWRACLARKGSKLDEEVTAHVNNDDTHDMDDYMWALLGVRNQKSVRGILQTCAYLERGTRRSSRVCEVLANAGAVDVLVKLIESMSQSVPEQQVLKHSISTLDNISRHPTLLHMLAVSRPLVRTLLWELLRNKGEGYFKVAGVLKRMCSSKEGVEAVKNEYRMLNRLVESHAASLKAGFASDKRCGGGMKERSQIRVKELVDILTLLSST